MEKASSPSTAERQVQKALISGQAKFRCSMQLLLTSQEDDELLSRIYYSIVSVRS